MGFLPRAIAALGVAAMTSACATGAASVYRLNSVPEEGGIRFTRITTDEDLALGPQIQTSRQFGLQYYVSRFFDVSPDGQSIAFISGRNDKKNVFLKSTQGGAATTQRTFRDWVQDVSFASDGTRLAFSDFRNERWNVFEIGARSGSAIKQLTTADQASVYPVYAPNENRVLYVQHENSAINSGAAAGSVTRYYVWSYDMDRGAHTQYAEGYAPAFSPDGREIAVTRNSRDHGNSEIWLISLATGEETLIASSAKQGFAQPSFSPDGARLVFTGVTIRERDRPTNFDIFTIDRDGSNMTQMTFHPGHDLMGKFGPDGNSIYFLSERGSDRRKYNIWRMDLR